MCFLESWWDLRWIDARLDAVIQPAISFEVALGRLCDTLIDKEEFEKYSACLDATPNKDLDGTFTLRLLSDDGTTKQEYQTRLLQRNLAKLLIQVDVK